MASAPSASFGDTSRQFEFEQASINGVESIEINKTTTASMDADAPAGRINLRSRSAFDRKSREITAQVTLTGNQYSWDVRKTPGPYNDRYFKIRPGFVFSYAEAFKGRFGVQLSLAGNTVGTEQAGVTHAYTLNLAGRGPVLTQIAFRDAPKLSNRSSLALTTDYKFSPNLSVSLRTSASNFDDGTNLRQTAFFMNAAQVTPDSTVTSLTALPTANANTRVQYTTSRRNKGNTTVTYIPKLEYKRGDLNLTLGGGYRRARCGSFMRALYASHAFTGSPLSNGWKIFAMQRAPLPRCPATSGEVVRSCFIARKGERLETSRSRRCALGRKIPRRRVCRLG